MGGVDVIRDGNKADPISWEYPAQVASGFNVLSSQAGEVFLCQVGTKKFLRFYKPFIGG